MEAKHTATPWRAEESTVGDYTGFDINCAAPGNKKWIASVHSAHNLTGNESPELAEKEAQEIATARANAEFIVRACNAHDDLVKLTKDAQSILAAYLPPDGISKDECISQLLALLDGPQSRAALSAAGA